MKGKEEFLDGDGEFDGVKAYGAILGTFLVCSWVEIILAFIKPQVSAVLSRGIQWICFVAVVVVVVAMVVVFVSFSFRFAAFLY